MCSCCIFTSSVDLHFFCLSHTVLVVVGTISVHRRPVCNLIIFATVHILLVLDVFSWKLSTFSCGGNITLCWQTSNLWTA